MTTKAAPLKGDASDEERVYGLRAGLAVFQHRRADIRRVYVDEARLGEVRALLRWCAKNAIAYHVVGPENLEKVTRSTHHEGLCLLARRPPELSLEELARELSASTDSARVLLLENVRDPHNVGAIVRTAAHFGVRAVLLAGETARRSSALLRTAEGGAEATQLVPVGAIGTTAKLLEEAGVTLLATSSHAERSLYEVELPQKICLLLGAEREGLSKQLLARAQRVVVIPGTGAVESLNVAAATAVVLGELARRAAPGARAAPQTTSQKAPGASKSTPAQARRRGRPRRNKPPR